MTLEQLEAEVLALPRDSQVALLARLLGHLGQAGEIDQEVASIWAEEAERRDQAMDNVEKGNHIAAAPNLTANYDQSYSSNNLSL